MNFSPKVRFKEVERRESDKLFEEESHDEAHRGSYAFEEALQF